MNYLDEVQKAYDEANVAELVLSYDDVMKLTALLQSAAYNMFLTSHVTVVHFTMTREKVSSHRNSKLKMYRLKSCVECRSCKPKSSGHDFNMEEESKLVDNFNEVIHNILGE